MKFSKDFGSPYLVLFFVFGSLRASHGDKFHSVGTNCSAIDHAGRIDSLERGKITHGDIPLLFIGSERFTAGS